MNKRQIKKLDINNKTLKELMDENKGIKLIRIKSNGKKIKKYFYNLFTKETKESLIKYDKSILEYYKKLEQESGWSMKDRHTLISKKLNDEDISECSVVRKACDFIPSPTEDEDSFNIETKFCDMNRFRLRQLAVNLSLQDRFVDYSIRQNLKNRKDYEFAKELSYYLGFVENENNKYVK